MRAPETSFYRILPLTSIRFFAAIAIFLNHTLLFRAIPLVNQLEMPLLAFGYAGTTAFFILSGFLLTAKYQRSFQLHTFDWKHYFINRWKRIIPLHLLTLGITIPFVVYEYGEQFWSLFVTNLLLLQSYIPSLQYAYSFNSVAWSLSALVFCWIAFPYMMRSMLRFHSLSAILLLWMIEFVFVLFIATHEMTYFLLYISPISRIVEFVTGMLLYRFFMSHPMTPHYTRPITTALELESILVLCMSIFLVAYVPNAYRFSIFFLPSVSICILLFSYARGSVSAWLSKKVFLFLGTISFEFIMFQLPMIRIFLDYVGVFFHAGYGIRLLLSFIATFLISILYHAIAHPTKKLGI
ncbi:MAG: acyltransferase [Microgenomates group bacterium]